MLLDAVVRQDKTRQTRPERRSVGGFPAHTTATRECAAVLTNLYAEGTSAQFVAGVRCE
jgi:hypothetical protein